MKMYLWLTAGFFFFTGIDAFSGDWLEWRGPHRNGHAAETSQPPVRWSESQNIKWKIRVPGRGHSSPTILGDLVVLTSADRDAQSQFVIAFDRSTGQQTWNTVVHRGHLPSKIHKKNTHASPSPVSDGSRIFVVFLNGSDVFLTCFDKTGKTQWQVNTGAFRSRYPYGYAPSPVLYQNHVIVTAESERIGYIAAFDKTDGTEKWRIPRTAGTSYSTPVVAHVAGKDQLLISGQAKVSSYDPATGTLLWQVKGSSPATCGTMVWNDDTVFASGGFPNKETIAVRADGSGRVLWKNGEKCYEQSMIHVDGHIYALNDGGIGFCWDAETGAEKWKVRLGGPVSSSPVYADGKIYATNERGTTFVFEANPSAYREVSRNQLGETGFATLSIVDDQVYYRTAFERSRNYEEWLFCIGRP